MFKPLSSATPIKEAYHLDSGVSLRKHLTHILKMFMMLHLCTPISSTYAHCIRFISLSTQPHKSQSECDVFYRSLRCWTGNCGVLQASRIVIKSSSFLMMTDSDEDTNHSKKSRPVSHAQSYRAMKWLLNWLLFHTIGPQAICM